MFHFSPLYSVGKFTFQIGIANVSLATLFISIFDFFNLQLTSFLIFQLMVHFHLIISFSYFPSKSLKIQAGIYAIDLIQGVGSVNEDDVLAEKVNSEFKQLMYALKMQ